MKIHWIHDMRTILGLNQEEMAAFLELSKYTVRSIELDKRFIPLSRAIPAMALYNAVQKAVSNLPAKKKISAEDPAFTGNLQYLWQRYRRRLERMAATLEGMYVKYHIASLRLLAYQYYSDSSTGDQVGEAQRTWIARRTAEARKLQLDNNVPAQALLSVEMTALSNVVRALEAMLHPQTDASMKVNISYQKIKEHDTINR